MKFFIYIIPFIIIACNQQQETVLESEEKQAVYSESHEELDSKTDSTNTLILQSSTDTIIEECKWANEYILKYLKANKGRLIAVDGYPVTYIKESRLEYQRKFCVTRIGHSFESHYVTDQWIYIDSVSKKIYEYDVANDTINEWIHDPKRLTDGKYHFDIAYHEHMGQSLGEKVFVTIKSDSIFINYDGSGNIENTPDNFEFDSGIIMWNEPNQTWIIGHSVDDKNSTEVGGCSDGPTEIDFENEKWWSC